MRSPASVLAPLVLAALALLAPAALPAQPVPVTPAVQLSPPAGGALPGNQVDSGVSVVALPGGSFAAGWQSTFQLTEPGPGGIASVATEVRFVDGAGRPGTLVVPAAGDVAGDVVPGPPLLAPGMDSGPVVTWWQGGFDSIEVWAQRYGADALPRSEPFVVSDDAPGPSDLLGPLLASDPDGGFVIVWTEDPAGSGQGTVLLQGFSPSGAPAGPRVELAPNVPGLFLTALSVGIDAEGRFFLIVAEAEPGGPAAVWGQRFALDGTPLGPRKPIPAGRLAVQRDGRFLLLWRNTTLGWGLSRYSAVGDPVSPFHPIPLPFDARIQSLSADRFDNTAVVALSEARILLLLANRYLVAQLIPVDIGQVPGGFLEPVGAAALHATGTLYAAWTGLPQLHPSGDIFHFPVRGRLFEVQRDADFCAYRGNLLVCNTAGRGQSFDTSVGFGRGLAAGDVALLGDVDGNLRDDLCVVRNRRTLCDTLHDGGTANLRTPAFGLPGDLPLLGDLNGDGRADPCRFRSGRFLCDTARNGGAAEVSLAFGLAGDVPLLGDVDGDGDDDPCVARAGRFLCDTAHNGGTAELRINLRSAFGDLAVSGRPLLGDVDGDGRADPCVFAGSRLLCGFPGPAGGPPRRILDRFFDTGPGDLPLLGDVDSF